MKILIVGLGGIGQRHMRNLRELLGNDVELLGVDPRSAIPVLTDKLQVEYGVSLQGKYGITIFTDLDPALSAYPDAVYICNPTSMHISTAMRAAQAGCHLFVEKPLSHNLEQVVALVDLVEARKLVSVVGYQMRFHPGLQLLHALLQQKKIGRILSVRAEIGEYLPGWHTYEDYRTMYASRKDLGGGVILSQIHEMDYLYWFFGLPSSVYALGGHLSHLEVDVEDTVEILMKFKGDGQPIPVSLHEDYVQRPPSRGCTIIGDSGKIVLDIPGTTLTVFDSEGHQSGLTSFKDFQRNQMFLEETRHFISALQNNTTPLVSVRDGLQSLRMALAARESLETGKVVELR